MWSGPSQRLVAGLVTDHRVGDLVGPMRHRTGDHPTVLAAGPQSLPVPFRGRLAQPQPDAEVDQRPAQLHAAFPADRPVAAPAGGLVLGRR